MRRGTLDRRSMAEPMSMSLALPVRLSMMLEGLTSPWTMPSRCRAARPARHSRRTWIATPGFKREAAKFEEYVTLMRPAEGHLEACPMPALNRRFTTYTLTPDRIAQRQAAE